MRLLPDDGAPLLSQQSATLVLVVMAGGWNVLRDVLMALAHLSF